MRAPQFGKLFPFMRRRLLWFLPVVIIFWNLGYAPFWNPDEGRYVAVAYEMAHPFDGAPADWIMPHLDTVPRLNKPPLIYWATAISFQVFGVHDWSGRLAPALASLLVLVLLYVWGARVWGWRAGGAAGLVWATGVGGAAMQRITNTDMLLCAAIALTMFGIFWAIEGGAKRLHAGALAGVGIGLALLSKGPVGVALPLLFAFVYLSAVGGWKRAPWGALALALGVGVAIGAPWYLAVEARQPGFLHHFIFAENLGRFSGQKDFHNKTSPFYYLPVVVVGLLPWTGFLVPMIASWRESHPSAPLPDAPLSSATPSNAPLPNAPLPNATLPHATLAMRAKLFAAVWAILLIGFFSVSGTKLISYALPAFPALALLLGATLGRFDEIGVVWRRAAIGLTLLFNALLLVAMWAIPHRDKATKTWELAPGVLLDNVIVPREVGWPWTLVVTALLIVFSAALLWLWRAKSARATLTVMGAGATGIVVVLLGIAGSISSYEDATRMFAALRPVLRPDDRVASYRAFVPSLIPYAARPLMMFTFHNSSGLAPADVAQSPHYSTDPGDGPLKLWLRKPGRAFIVTEGLKDPQLIQSLYLWGRTNDFFLLSNQPRPAGFDANLTFASPKRSQKNQLLVPPDNHKGEP